MLLQEFSDNAYLFLNKKIAVSMVEFDQFLNSSKASLGLELGELKDGEDGDGNAASFDDRCEDFSKSACYS